MMLSAFEFTNFQSFESGDGQPLHRIELSKLNLLYGPNSNGKSAILRALKFVGKNLQVQNVPSTEIWDFEVEGLNLGDFANVVSRHDEKRNMIFSFEFFKRIEVNGGDKESLFSLKSFYRSLGIDNSAQLLELAGHYGEGWFDLQFKISLVLTKPGRLDFVSFEVLPYVLDPEGPIGQDLGFAFRSLENEGSYVWQFESAELKRDMIQSLNQVAIINDFLTKHRQNKPSIDRLNENRFDGLDLIFLEERVELGGPHLWVNDGLGNKPSPMTTAFEEFNIFIETIWGFLVDSICYFDHVKPLREIPSVIQEKNSPLFKEIKSRLSLSEFVPSLKEYLDSPHDWFRRITDQEFDFEMKKLEIPGSNETYGLWVLSQNSRTSFENVGVGLSQVLPVLFSLFPHSHLWKYSGTRSVYLEQPELHLHPRMQGDLADAMIASINSNFVEAQLLIETHSEALILRLLRRIKDGRKPSPDSPDAATSFRQSDLSVHYISKTDGKSKITTARISEDGEMLDPWPLNFVDLRMTELFS